MTNTPLLTRRTMLLSGLAVATFAASPVRSAGPSIHVVKGTGCECCNAWVAYLRDEGFTVTDEVDHAATGTQARRSTVPSQRRNSASCGVSCCMVASRESP